MQIKCSSLIFVALSAMLAISLALSGCGGNADPSPTTPVKPSSITKTSPTPAVDPNAPPAVLKISNIRSVPSPEDGPNVYLFYVDVENSGGQPGTYQATYRIDNNEIKNETKKITVNPGQKKQLEIIGPEQEIISLGQDYDTGVISERRHIVFVGDLFITIILAERPRLQLITSDVTSANGNITVSGDVKNISNATIEHVIAVAELGAPDGRIVKNATAPVDYEPVMPGQTTPFKVVFPNIPESLVIQVYRVTFQDETGAIIRATTTQTQ